MFRFHSRWLVAMALIGLGAFGTPSVHAGGRHGHSGSYYQGGYRGSYSSSSYYSYSNPYLNPYSYESQALPYWLKPGYRSGGGYNYSYSTPASRPDRYGAIAYSRTTGTYGYSYSQYSQDDAEREALNQCESSDRAVIGWMRNAYGALAVGASHDQYGWGWGATREAAKQAALDECRKLTDDCTIKLTVFSGN